MAQAEWNYDNDNTPITLVYNHSGNVAFEPERIPVTTPREEPKVWPVKTPRTRYKTEPDPKLKLKLVYLSSLVVIGLMLLAVVAGGVRVAESHGRINEIESVNNELRLRINDLELELEQSIDLNSVIEVAQKNGMVYPTIGQVAPEE